jgi:poly(3-hydroxyalkanoate) synthetase
MQTLKNKILHQQLKLTHLKKRLFSAQSLILSQNTPFEIITRYKHASIRYYAADEKKYQEPLVFVAPLAVNMAIYDLYPYRSLVKHFQKAGFDVYLIDWGTLDYQHQQLNFLSFIDDLIPYCLARILEHAQSEQLSLHGWSMSGIFVTLYTARHQPKCVKNLIVLGSPIDSYASGRIGQLFKKTYALIKRKPNIHNYIIHEKIPKKYIHSPGLLNALGFKIIDPIGWFNSQKQLLLNLDKIESLQEHATMGDFLNKMIDYPGGINQDMVLHLWLQNPLRRGFIDLQGQRIELKKITCPLMLGIGTRDQIVTEAAAKPLIELTSSSDITFTQINGGHLGLMSNQHSAKEFWPTLEQWLVQRSTTR